jgi:hypothetical protein
MNWKSAIFILSVVTGINIYSSLYSQTDASARIWKGNEKNDGSVHALGNGKMLVYENGTNIINFYPSPYSTPSLLNLEILNSDNTQTSSVREQGTAIWTHSVFQNGRLAGSIVDFVDSGLPCMVRRVTVTEKVSFRLKLKDFVEAITNSELTGSIGQKGKILFLVPSGTIFYQKYAYPRPLYFQIGWSGNVNVEQKENSKNEYIISFYPGESELDFLGGPEYPQVIENYEESQLLAYNKLLERTRIWWKKYTSERIDFENKLPVGLPLRQKLLETIDDFSVMVRTQQAHEGSVMAGYPYPLGYVRDQYGVSRGLLALGYTVEARHILEFYWNIWKRYGVIHNAQGIGIEGVFHIHENDEVETPGYLIIQAFDLLEKTGDHKFIDSIFPMLEWCWEVQKKHLVRGMLPFNGDETYVAGGFLPRSALNDGSAESTLLFIDGGEKYLKWAENHKKWTSVKLENERRVLDNTRNLFRENFWRGGQLITNNPERVKITAIPRFRHGVCERGGSGCIVSGRSGFFGIDWTERDENDRYQCPVCLAQGPLPRVEPCYYNLISVSLTPLYMHSGLLGAEELKPMIEKVYEQYAKTGILSCVFDSTGKEKNKRTVGYDYGLLLYSMLESGMNNTETIYKKTLLVTDSAGVWSEYYNNNKPQGTRYRPWESAINMEALLKFASHYK